MYLLASDSAYIDGILAKTGCLTVSQILRLLRLEDIEKTLKEAKGAVKQLCYYNRAYLVTEDLVTPLYLEKREPDADMLTAIDIMLDLIKEKPKILSAGQAPYKLCFFTGQDARVFAIVVVHQGQESVVNAYFEGSNQEQTIIFHLKDLQQTNLIKINQPHFFAVSDSSGLHYFKGT